MSQIRCSQFGVSSSLLTINTILKNIYQSQCLSFPFPSLMPYLSLVWKLTFLLPLIYLLQKETGFRFQDCQIGSFRKSTKIHSVIAHHRTHPCSLRIEVSAARICWFDSSVINFETTGTVKCLSDNGVPELSHAKIIIVHGSLAVASCKTQHNAEI